MARVKRSVHARKKRRKVMERASGYTGARSRRYRTAREQTLNSRQYAYRDRRARKGDFPQALDHADQRSGPAQRHDIFTVHRGTEGSGYRR